MNEEYDQLEQEYDHALSRVRSFLSSNVRSQTTLKECNRLLTQAKRCASGMEDIAEESGDAFQISEAKFRVDREVNPLLDEVERALREKKSGVESMEQIPNTASSNRELLFSGSGYRAPTMNANGNFNDDNNEEEMEMLIRNSEDLLLESQALCSASEQTGSETLFTMGRQREQLTNGMAHIAGANAIVEQAKGLLRSMHHKALRNKRTLHMIIAVLIVANITVIIAIVKKKLKN
jgi:predicted RNase H-like nuclease (RuvC/YqgF family)